MEGGDNTMYRVWCGISVYLFAFSVGCGGDDLTSSTIDCLTDDSECPQGQRCVTDESGRGACITADTGSGPVSDGFVPDGQDAGGSLADAQPELDDGMTEPPPREETFNVEARQLAIPYDDPADPRTISTVLGVRSVYSIDATRIEIRMGPSFNVPEANDPQGYQVYSPDDPNYVLDDLVEPVSVALHSDPDVAPAVPDSDGRAFEQHVITLTVPHALVSVRSISYAPSEGVEPHKIQ